MPHLKEWVLFVLFLFCLTAPIVEAQDIMIITNADVPIDSITVSDVKKIFLGKKSIWENGRGINFFTMDQTVTHKTFLKKFIRKSSAQYKIFWKKQVFSGKGEIPKSSGSDQDMVKRIASTNGAIGYVSAKADLGTVKILSIK